MRVAVLCDVHGNLPALEAVLAEVASLEVDRIVCGGDVVAGPFPRECLDALVGLDAVFVRGNADRESPRAPEGTWEWIAAQARPACRLSSCASFHRPSRSAVSSTATGRPRDDDEILTRVSSDERFRAALEGVEERLVVGGHTHVQFERVVDGIRFVNAGSVGIPYEGKQGAFWAARGRRGASTSGTRHTRSTRPWPLIRTSGYPGAEQIAGWLLEPEDPDAVSAYFESVAT